MRRRDAVPTLLAATWLLAVLSTAACIGDPGSELTLQIHNTTNRLLRVTVSRMWDMPKAPPHEEIGIEVIVEPGATKDAAISLAAGDYAGPVRAYSDGRLIFCQNYDYRTGPRARVTWSVDIVEGHITCQ